MRLTLKNILIVGFTALLWACAQIKPPTGGAKDETPPEVIQSEPENFTVNFRANQITLEFNEFIQLRNLSQQLVINPSMEERPEFKVRGKKLIVDIKSPLADSTTYVINFGDAVVDLTEGNKAEGLKYVFSTGDYLDSLQYKGQVLDAFEKEPIEDALIMLYSNPSDTMPYKGTPDYFGKTDKSGQFEINYIREGNYMVFALLDPNSNYRYNPPAEAIGFLDGLVAPGPPDSTNQPVRILMFNEEDTTQYIDSREAIYPGQYRVVFYQPTDSASFVPLNERVELITEHGRVGDTLTAWIQNKDEIADLDKIQLIVKASSQFTDTVTWQFATPKEDQKTTLSIRDNLLFNFNPQRPMRFSFKHPVERVDTSRISLFQDSVQVNFEWKSTSSSREFELHHDWEPGVPYRVLIPDSTVWDIFEWTNDTLDKTVEMREDRYFGNLQFDLQFDESESIILEVLNDRDVVIHKITPESSGLLEFNRMSPGTYSMRVIYDLNGNGEWDTGSYMEKRQPEPVEVYESSIRIRSNWDLELSWDLTGESGSD